MEKQCDNFPEVSCLCDRYPPGCVRSDNELGAEITAQTLSLLYKIRIIDGRDVRNSRDGGKDKK